MSPTRCRHILRFKKIKKLHLFALAIVALGPLLPGCGGSKDTAQVKHSSVLGGAKKQPVSLRDTAHSVGLTVILTATPTRAKTDWPVQFNFIAYASHALGALGYQLRFGDGTSAENVVPQFCVAGEGAPRRQMWRLSHHYKATGRYRASVSVYVSCSSDSATATVAVSIAWSTARQPTAEGSRRGLLGVRRSA
jgi:hypothetical protein